MNRRILVLRGLLLASLFLAGQLDLKCYGQALSLADKSSVKFLSTRASNRKSNPNWPKKVFQGRTKVRVGTKRYTRHGFEVSNGAFKVSMPITKELISPVLIQSYKNRKYKLKFYPLGYAAGNIMDKKFAEGTFVTKKLTDNLFSVNWGIPTKIDIKEISKTRIKITVECDPHVRMRGGKKPDVTDMSRFELYLTWQSPIIELKCYRRYAKDFYNHNGHILSKFDLEKQPFQVISDLKNKKPVTLQSGKKPFNPYNPEQVNAWQSFEIQEARGNTIFSFPKFRKRCIYRPMFSVVQGTLMTAISQSGGEGWLPILQKAGDYNDHIILICDSGNAGKTMHEWLKEIKVPEPDRDEMIRHELRVLVNRANAYTFYNKKNPKRTIDKMMKQGKQKIIKKYGISREDLEGIAKKGK